MNVLIVTNRLPYPPTSGGEIRTHGIAEGLRRARHNVTLLCFHEGDAAIPDGLQAETVPPPPPRSKSWRLKTLLLTRQPDVARRLESQAMEAKLRALLAENDYDLIQFEGIESVWSLPLAKTLAPNAKLAFDTFNAEYALQHSIFQIDIQNPRRWPVAVYSWLQVGRIRRYEARLCALADLVFAVSDEDAALLQPLRPDGRIHVVNSGIWVDRYSDENSMDLGDHALVFTGSMDYRPNVDAALWFAEAVFPAVQQAVPDARFVIVGKDPHPRLDALRSVNGITITGRVDSVLPYLRGAALFVVPLRMGSGTRLKLLEAMAAGCAIVATDIACAGLNEATRQMVQIANTAEDLQRVTVELLQDPNRRGQLRGQMREQVRNHYDWSVLVPRLLSAYRSVGLDA